MFKTAVDIMLFKGFRQEDPDVLLKKAEILAEEAEKAELKKLELQDGSVQAREQRDAARGEAEVQLKLPSADLVRKKTLQKIKDNARRAIREEATQILKKALEAIEFAVSDEKFSVELGGPGRHDPGPIILPQAYSNYHEDARQVVVERLTTQGYKVEEVDKIFIRISW